MWKSRANGRSTDLYQGTGHSSRTGKSRVSGSGAPDLTQCHASGRDSRAVPGMERLVHLGVNHRLSL